MIHYEYKWHSFIKGSFIGSAGLGVIFYMSIALIRKYPLIPSVGYLMVFFNEFGLLYIVFFVANALLTIYAAKHFSYALTDSGIVFCKLYKNGWKPIRYIEWKDITRIKYRSVSIRTLWQNDLTVYSIYRKKLRIDDGLHDFQEIVKIIKDKTKADAIGTQSMGEVTDYV